MTSQEAYKGIRQIEAHYGQKFMPKDIAPIWGHLLQLPVEAMTRAAGEAKMIWKRFPGAHDLLAAVKRQAERMNLDVVNEGVEEGQAVFNLFNAFLAGRISEAEYIKGLYAMASVYGKPEYAADAEAREAALRERGEL